ncbi:integrator complex subunit 1 isoform X2 [Hydra vulgaris]|uniref:Integrator complex subunit 1 isoform X2 n=1 Tax=Hydra vulgaris TaxID=6087 RepID=A0ABM4CV67_HYDVU
MEKQRANSGPKPRLKRALPLPGDMIALGKMPGSKIRPELDAGKHSQAQSRKPNMTTIAHKRKDIVSQPVQPVTNVKPPRDFSPSFIKNKEGSSLKLIDSDYTPFVKLIESQAMDLEDEVLTAHANQDLDKIEGLLCNALKLLKANRMKPDPMLYLTLIYLAKLEPIFFQSKAVVEYLLALLRKENTGMVVKTKPNILLCVMACNILFHAFSNETSWPQSFLKVYVEDALGDRSWVDNENNNDFVSNITSVFGTQPLPKQAKTEEERLLAEAGIFLELSDSANAVNRYPTQKDEQAIFSYINDVVKEQVNKRQVVDSVSRNLLRFLVTVCGYADVRLLASQKIETWIQNPKLTRPAQDLLMSVALNCNTHSLIDIEVIGNLIRMRLKQKPLVNHYILCIKELLTQHPDNLGTVMKHIVYNELSQQRNPNNMSLLNVIFSCEPEKSAQYLSTVFLELLCNREDYIRAIRALLREIVRTLKYEVNMVEFCRSLMQERCDSTFTDLDQIYKDRIFSSVIDLICLGCFLSISPQVKELSNPHSRDFKDLTILRNFQKNISIIQRDAVWFFHTKVLPMYRCNEKDFVLGLRHILFLDTAEQYCSKDSWPPESDRQSFLQLVQDVPLMEDCLIRLHLIGFANDLPINCAATLDIIEKVVLRAAKLNSGSCGIVIERTEVINMLLNLSAYTHPKDINLPVGYNPPNLAISNLYWKAWWVLLVLVATNPSTIGVQVWQDYPTARCMMEMIITGAYSFPPLAVQGFSSEEIQANELQVSRAEKDDIIEFESHLAAATSGAIITESTSLLISQLISLKPLDLPRQPPATVIEKLKQLNKSLELNELLCQSRSPDFLLYIIQAQGTSKAMPWLADLVQSSESSLKTLPVQCLCEFLLMKHVVNIKNKSIKEKVASRLQDLLIGSEATIKSSKELVKYFISRWSSSDLAERDISVEGFRSILIQRCNNLSNGNEKQMESYAWIQEKLTMLPYFQDLLPYLIKAFQKALCVEVNVPRLEAYISFLIQYCLNQVPRFFHKFIKYLSYMIVRRKTITHKLLYKEEKYVKILEVFAFYLQSSLSQDSTINIKQTNEHVIVTWSANSPYCNNAMTVLVEAVQAAFFLMTRISDHQLGSYKFVMDLICANDVKFSQNIFSTFLCDVLLKSRHPHLAKTALDLKNLNEVLALTNIFGFPLESVNMILNRLDVYCMGDAKSVQKIVNQNGQMKMYCQWVELNWELGAIGGKIFYELLDDVYKNKFGAMAVDEIDNNLNSCNLLMETEVKKDVERICEFNEQSVKECLEQFFVGHSSKMNFYSLKKQLAFSNIQKKDGRIPEKIFFSLKELIANKKFLDCFCISNQSAPLLKLLILHFQQTDSFLEFLKTLVLCSAHKSKSMDIVLNSLCKRFGIIEEQKTSPKITKTLGDFIRSGNKATLHCLQFVINEIRQIEDITEVSRDQWVSAGKLISSSFESMFERFMQVLCAGAINVQARRLCIDILIELVNVVDHKFIGILVTYFHMLDPEIVCLIPLMQRQLIFKHPTGTAGSSFKAKSYLISLLTHQAQNGTLDDCFKWILDVTSDVKELNPKHCLNVVELLIQNPRLWYRGEGKEAKELSGRLNESADHLNLNLTLQQIYQFIQFILYEANQLEEKENQSFDLRQNTIQLRLPLLFDLVGHQTKVFKKALQLTRLSKRFPLSLVMIFLQMVYMHNPLFLPDLSCDLTDVCQTQHNVHNIIYQHKKTEVDKLIHRLILSISEPDGSFSWEEKFQSVSAMIRRIANNHPLLYLRQLPVILSLLQGKSRVSPATFRITQSFRLFMHVLSLCDLLHSHIFMQNELSKMIMELFVDVFLQLVQSPCLNRDQCTVVVTKLVELVNGYISSGNPNAANILSQHEFVFMDLMYAYPTMHGLTAICTFIKIKDSTVGATLCASSATTVDKSQLSSLKTRFVTYNSHQKELMDVIHELDESSKRRVDILEYFSTELSLLSTSSSQEIRNESHMLLLRHCVHKPSQAAKLINVYLECLESNDPDIVSSASMHLPQFLLFVDVNCGKLLKRLFDISTKYCALNDTHLLKAVANLNIDFV